MLAQVTGSVQLLGGGIGGLSSKLATLQNGAGQLADGSRKLADAVKLLVDQTKQMGAGLNDASGFWTGMKTGASAPPMAGFYIPLRRSAATNSKKPQNFISPDGHAARYLVQTKLNPFSIAAMDQVNSILNTAQEAQPNTALVTRKCPWSEFRWD